MVLPRSSSIDYLSLATTNPAQAVLMEPCSGIFLQSAYIDESSLVSDIGDNNE